MFQTLYKDHDRYVKSYLSSFEGRSPLKHYLMAGRPISPMVVGCRWGSDCRVVTRLTNAGVLRWVGGDGVGYYNTFDAGKCDKDGYIHVMTRIDDVINVAGHRLSTGNMEVCGFCLTWLAHSLTRQHVWGMGRCCRKCSQRIPVWPNVR